METKNCNRNRCKRREFGRATAVRLAKDFSELVLAARWEQELEETAAAVKAAGQKRDRHSYKNGWRRSVRYLGFAYK